MYCLDTNVIIDIFRGDELVIKKVEPLWNKEIFVTSISLCELYKGAHGYFNSEDKIKLIDDFLNNVKVISLNRESAREFGLLWQKLRGKGRTINDFDILIASMIKCEKLTFVTRDGHFRSLGINVIII